MKIAILLPAVIMCMFTGCQERPPTVTKAEKKNAFAQNYKPPVFIDPERMANLQSAIPAAEKVFKAYAEENHFPAMAYGIVADNKLIFSGATGFVNLTRKTPATTKSMFRIASMTKSFTAMAILKLRDEGKLRLTDPASGYIKDMSGLTYLTEDSPGITIQNLLTMSAGFPEDNPWGDRQLADTPEELDAFIKDGISFSNATAKDFEYSNLGYGMLGRIIGVVSGVPYQQYITENILKPLGMLETQWEFSNVDPSVLALGYRWEDEQWKEEPLLHDGIFGAMGGLITTIEDFSKYVNLHLSAWPPRNGPETGPVKRSSLREMHKPFQFVGINANAKRRDGTPCPDAGGYGYGLGWRKNCDGVERISHSGGLPGFGSEYRFYPEYGIGVISFANLTYAPAGRANAYVMDTLFAIANLKPRKLPVSDTLQLRTDQLVDVLKSWDQNLEKKIFAENFYLDLSRESWIKKSKRLWETIGEVRSIDPIVPENQLRGRFVIHGQKKDAEIFFTLTPERSPKIQQVDFIEMTND